MELSLITPVAHLEWTKLLPGRFCIASVAAFNSTYKVYFTTTRGYTVILDNGVFEGEPLQDGEYIKLAQEIRPQVLVVPDTINADAKQNLASADRFTERLQNYTADELFRRMELMYVVQCKRNDYEGFWSTLYSVLASSTYKWIGICRDAVYNAFAQFTHTTDQELNRFYFAAELQRQFTPEEIRRKKWHFLGMGKRLDLLPHFWFVDAMDTASLFYQATLGNMVENGILPDDLKRPRDYFVRDFRPEYAWEERLKHNCKEALKYAQQANELRRQLLGGRL